MTIDPRVRTAAYDRYEILSTYDIPSINRQLGTSYTSLSEVCTAQSEAFGALSTAERRQDYKAINAALDPIAAVRS